MALRGAVYVNGTIKPAHEAAVPVYDHGFLYGEGVYETLRTYDRQPFLFARHMRRLRRSARMIALDVPFDDARMAEDVRRTLDTAGIQGEAYIRILLPRAVGEPPYDPAATPTP